MAGLTLVRDTFRNVPVAIEIDPEYSDQLWVKDNRFENISGAAVVISNEKNPMTEIGVENAVCAERPGLRQISGEREDRSRAPAPIYRVDELQLRPHRP